MRHHLSKILLSIILIFFSSYILFAEDYEGPIQLWEGYNVSYGSDVKLFVFRPKKSNSIGVVICPGGSYYWLDEEGEGLNVGKWLAKNGYTAFVLYYRTAGRAEIAWHTRIMFRGKRHPDMITDAQRALQYVWENNEQYNVEKDKIGVLGFSAGGHLAMSTACFSSTDFLARAGINTDANLRPAFVASIYPVVTMNPPFVHKRSRRGLLGDIQACNKRMRDSLSIENHIPDNCPPVFLINCKDDPVVPYQNSVLLDSALTSKGVSHQYIQYSRGKHGFGVSDYFGSPECREWRNEFLKWLECLYCTSL